jgi:cytochrome c biogenesis protein CcmG, thiol:disulfide interchange protein DsbE
VSRYILAFALILALTACYSGTKPTRIGTQAPDFVLQDGDRKVALHDYKGKVVVLNFWATWCPPCVEEMPSLVQMQKKLKGTDITVLAVSLDVDEGAYKKFIRDHGVDLLTVRDPDQKSNSLYGTYKFPETFVIDKNGVLRRKFIGAVDWNDPQIAQYLATL